MSNSQETYPKQDILEEAMNCIYDDSNLQILLDEITDLKTRIENLERQIIQIIVIPLPCVNVLVVVINELKKKLFSFPFSFFLHHGEKNKWFCRINSQ